MAIYHNAKHYWLSDEDWVYKGILTQDEMDYQNTLKIPYNAPGSAWRKLHDIIDKQVVAIEAGLVPEKEAYTYRREAPGFISDSLGIHGIQSQADGKYYDSKSKYRTSLKDHGMIEMGSDAPTKPRTETRGDFSNLKRDISKAYDQVVGT